MQNIAHKASSRPLTTAPTRRSIKSSDCWQQLDRHTADINVKVVLSKNREVRIYRGAAVIHLLSLYTCIARSGLTKRASWPAAPAPVTPSRNVGPTDRMASST